jgi:hypothetical protein
MDSGRDAPPGDMLQVIRRRAPSLGIADGTGSVSVRIRLAPARRRNLTRVVVAALGACTLILVAAGIAHLARANNETSAVAATEPSAIAPPAPVAAPVAAAAPAAPPVDIPQTGTLRLQRPATAGKVWLDGQKITTASATVACGSHQVKLGAHGKPHAIDVPCGGELRLSK